MIDALFGSKTRVKLLYLFLNNPGKSFYVREITRIIGEQINSVRRELSNMIEVGIVTSDSSDNKLYYQINQRYEHYVPLRAIFGNDSKDLNVVEPSKLRNSHIDEYISMMEDISGLRFAAIAGVLVKGSTSPVDVILVGDVAPSKVKLLIKTIESNEVREINYSVMSYDEFYYRLSVRDKFIIEILGSKHDIIIDRDKILKSEK